MDHHRTVEPERVVERVSEMPVRVENIVYEDKIRVIEASPPPNPPRAVRAGAPPKPCGRCCGATRLRTRHPGRFLCAVYGAEAEALPRKCVPAAAAPVRARLTPPNSALL